MRKLHTTASLLSLSALTLPAVAANPLPTYSSIAPIAYMWDNASGTELFAKDADKKIPPASMAKMMTVYVAFDMISKGELKLDQTFPVTPDIWQHWHGPAAGSTMFLSSGEKVSVANLLSGIVTLSGNDACVTLATGIAGSEPAFAERMNNKAAELGLKDSHFGTSNGWPDGGKTVVTARDLAHLASATISNFPALYKQFYGQKDFTWGKTNGGAAIKQDNRNPLLGKVAGADGLKTGHTEEAGYGFTGSAEQNGRRLIMVVAGLDTYAHRASESVQFMNWGFKAWDSLKMYPKGTVMGNAKIGGGTSRTVSAIAGQDILVTYPAGARPKHVATHFVNDLHVQAPIHKGQHVADLVMTPEGLAPETVPLVAADDVGEGNFLSNIWNGILNVFNV